MTVWEFETWNFRFGLLVARFGLLVASSILPHLIFWLYLIFQYFICISSSRTTADPIFLTLLRFFSFTPFSGPLNFLVILCILVSLSHRKFQPCNFWLHPVLCSYIFLPHPVLWPNRIFDPFMIEPLKFLVIEFLIAWAIRIYWLHTVLWSTQNSFTTSHT